MIILFYSEYIEHLHCQWVRRVIHAKIEYVWFTQVYVYGIAYSFSIPFRFPFRVLVTPGSGVELPSLDPLPLKGILTFYNILPSFCTSKKCQTLENWVYILKKKSPKSTPYSLKKLLMYSVPSKILIVSRKRTSHLPSFTPHSSFRMNVCNVFSEDSQSFNWMSLIVTYIYQSQVQCVRARDEYWYCYTP